MYSFLNRDTIFNLYLYTEEIPLCCEELNCRYSVLKHIPNNTSEVTKPKGSFSLYKYSWCLIFQMEMIEYVPSLMNAIRMIHTISQYYNTSERMTSLFVKVTNQMISTCKAYINKDVSRIWDLPRYLDLFVRHGCRAWNNARYFCQLHTKINFM